MTRSVGLLLVVPSLLAAQMKPPCAQHDRNCPAPRVVDPGPGLGNPLPPPADAVVLFDGKDLSKWRGGDDGPAKWKVGAGYVEVAPGTGMIHTADGFGDVQLHVEWMAPAPPRGSDQDRGNSGVFLMGKYEVQVLDSWGNVTYPDGQASAVYGQYPPLVNASRKPGQWQSYDIIFRRPRFGKRRQREEPGDHHGVPQRHPGAGPRGADRTDRTPAAATVRGPPRSSADRIAGPRASGPLPQHLDSQPGAVT